MHTEKSSQKSVSKKLFSFLNSIKTKLIISFLVITLSPLGYISYVMLRNASDGLLNVSVSNSMAHARKASIDLNRFIAGQSEIIRLLTQSRAAIEKDFSALNELYREYDSRHLGIERIRLIDLSGKSVAASGDFSGDSGFEAEKLLPQLEGRPWLMKTLQDQANANARSVAIIAAQKDSDSKTYGLLLVELNLLQLASLMSENVVGKSARIFVLDGNSQVICSVPENTPGYDVSLMHGKIAAREYGVFSIESKVLLQPLLVSYLPVVGLEWQVLLSQDQEEVYALVKTFQKNLYWILFLTVLIAVIIALVISQNIALPILQVTRGANELAAGKFDVRINVANTDEVGQLANNFNFMADSLAGKMEELRAAYDELQNRAETIQQTNVDLDRKVFEISILYKIGRAMGEIGIDLERLLDLIIDKALEAANAKRGSLMLIDENQEFLELQRVRIWNDETGKTVAINDFKKNINIRPGEGIAGKVLQSGQMLIINDPDNHPDFKQYEGEINRVEQLVCVPLRVKNVTFGVINIVNRKDGGDFDKKDTDLLETMANQAALVLENTKLFKLAITDGLTDLFLVRHFKIKLNEEIKRSRRYGKIFSVVFFDIDHFKKFNDTYGHQVGDEVLKQVAAVFRESLREDIDLPARYGGEEMIALLPETNAEGAYVVAERLRSRIEQHEFTGWESPLHVTISIGVAEFPLHDTDPLELIRKADTALYECKKLGRNRTSIYSDQMGVVSEK